MNRILKIFAAVFICSLTSVYAYAGSNKTAIRLCERQMQKAARTYNVPLGILYAVGLTETGRKNSLHPYALNIEGKAYFADTASEALAAIKRSRNRGVKLIDVGCMQINIHYHLDKFSGLKAMLDPAQNVKYAARFLSELKQREKSWTMAVARYHAGPNNNPAQKRYVCRVIKNIVASGYGRWTQNSLKFCK
ncbi:Transglycosylase SLT domain protein [Pseudovibrio axinellae]|uniref:Transglycosylase SLT domain protein n=1 Tax=Pseudovibrio axinellae TaxID=989403 RepID=A0A165XJ73_9HYPH|nr:transglycosylase SLT domain-containing protein [Pseudovibrio axinellae]KZL17757.1 Transglycosylase SLT domain protein [Pseudovibrio axinellae]SEP73841.1 Transglycosylase SLT domain-containing protein [Pseudovibrio axinellae]